MTNAIPNFDVLVRWSNQLYGLPATPLIIIFCWAVGYAAKWFPAIPNRQIPVWVLAASVVSNIILNLSARPEHGWDEILVWLVRTAIIGFIAGCAAWVLHAKLLKRVEQRFGWFDSDNNNPPDNSEMKK